MIASGVPADVAGSWHEEMSFLGEVDMSTEETQVSLHGTAERLKGIRALCPDPDLVRQAGDELQIALENKILTIHDWGFMPGAAGFELGSSFREGLAAVGHASAFGFVDPAGAELISDTTPPELSSSSHTAAAGEVGVQFVDRRLDLDGLHMKRFIKMREALDRDLTRFRLRLLELAADSPLPSDDPESMAKWMTKSTTILDIELARLLLSIDEAKRRYWRNAPSDVGGAALGGGGILGLLKSSIGFFNKTQSRLDSQREHPLFFVYRLATGTYGG